VDTIEFFDEESNDSACVIVRRWGTRWGFVSAFVLMGTSRLSSTGTALRGCCVRSRRPSKTTIEFMRIHWPVLAILCVPASLLVPGIASARTASGAETRVGAFDLAVQVRVGVERSLTL